MRVSALQCRLIDVRSSLWDGMETRNKHGNFLACIQLTVAPS